MNTIYTWAFLTYCVAQSWKIPHRSCRACRLPHLYCHLCCLVYAFYPSWLNWEVVHELGAENYIINATQFLLVKEEPTSAPQTVKSTNFVNFLTCIGGFCRLMEEYQRKCKTHVAKSSQDDSNFKSNVSGIYNVVFIEFFINNLRSRLQQFCPIALSKVYHVTWILARHNNPNVFKLVVSKGARWPGLAGDARPGRYWRG